MATTPRNPIDRDDPEQLEAGRAIVRQYLEEAHAVETALVTTLQAHITMTPTGDYRVLLERHLGETRQQARAIERRLEELGAGANVVSAAAGLARTLVGQVLALSKGPIDVLRGAGGEEKLLKNAKDECATEALEIATYDALEAAGNAVGDAKTVRLARQHRLQEERMLRELRELIPELTAATVLARAGGEPTYDLGRTGAADNVRELAGRGRSAARTAGGAGRSAARTAGGGGRSAARTARRAAPAADGGNGSSGGEGLPIADYDSLNADQIVRRLTELSQAQLRTLGDYERANRGRRSVLSRVEALQAEEPWTGYDGAAAEEIVERLREADEGTAAAVREYEGGHQRRVTVLEAAQQRLAAT